MTVLNLSYAISSGLFNSYGIAVSAAAGIGLKVNTMVAMVCWAVGQSVMTMAGQNLGREGRSPCGELGPLGHHRRARGSFQ